MGSVEALMGVLDTFDSDICELDVVDYGVGNVTENDLRLAESSGGRNRLFCFW